LTERADDKETRKKMDELAVRAARAAERALSRGDEDLFLSYRALIAARMADADLGIEAMAGRGIATADYALGIFWLHGMLRAPDLDRACQHFSAAAAKGFGGAKFRLAQCLESQEPERALNLLREAASAGHVAAMESLGRACLEATPPDSACALTHLQRAAEEGRASATTLLGWMYAEGVGVALNPGRAAEYYQAAAARGEVSARNNLGELFESGRGVAPDAAAAFAQYRLAAEAGFPPAQFNLGRLYAGGKGTAKDTEAARLWLGKASKAGIETAQRIIELLDREDAN
jgi:TPR repeat protein